MLTKMTTAVVWPVSALVPVVGVAHSDTNAYCPDFQLK
jgi:hypothetical protein